MENILTKEVDSTEETGSCGKPTPPFPKISSDRSEHVDSRRYGSCGQPLASPLLCSLVGIFCEEEGRQSGVISIHYRRLQNSTPTQSRASTQMSDKPQPSLQTRRLRTLVIAGPLLVVSTVSDLAQKHFFFSISLICSPQIILYKRLYKGEEQRKFPRPDDPDAGRTSIFQEVQKDQLREIQNARHPRA